MPSPSRGPFSDASHSTLQNLCLHFSGESHVLHTDYPKEVQARLIASGRGPGTTVGGNSADPSHNSWSAAGLTWTANSGYSGKRTDEQITLLAGESPQAAGADIWIELSGSNDAVQLTLTDSAVLDTTVNNYATLLEAQKARHPNGHGYLVSPLHSTSASVELDLAALRPRLVSLCVTEGVTYCDAQAGPNALGDSDVSGDQIHLTVGGYTKLGDTVATCLGY